ncbi:hypothetical protein BDN67DRAFT_872463, partial [Paxillus ammoniavirescens]
NNTPQRNRVKHSSSGGSKTYGGRREPMDIGAAQKGKCFNCGQDHFVRGCWIHVSQLEPSAPQTQGNLLAGMDYKAAKAYFYDLHITEIKAQGKGFG